MSSSFHRFLHAANSCWIAPRSSRGRFPAALLIACLLLLGGCESPAPEGDPAAAATGREAIVVAYGVDMRGVNELATDATAFHTALHYYALFLPLLEELADYQTGPPTFEPRLASSYEFSADRLQLTFHLRQDVVWSDGVPVTAEDVRWTWQAQTSPEVGWGLASYKRHISDVEVVDEHTVRFHYTHAYGTQLLDALIGVPLPRHAWSQLPFDQWRASSSWFLDHLVVNGPFTVESWEPQQRLILRRNERYYVPDRPRAERIVFQITPDRSSRLALLRSGQAHLVDWVEPADIADLEADPEVVLYSFIPRQFIYVCWNLNRPFFTSREVRRALTLAIDRQQIVDALYYGHAGVSFSPFASDVWAYNRDLSPLPYDPGQAKELLAAAGWVDTDGDGILDRDGQPFRFEILTNADNKVRADALVMIREHLRRVGIDAQPRLMDFNALNTRELAHDFDACLTSMGIGTDLDPSYFFRTGETYNFGLFSHPEIDRILDEIQAQPAQLPAKPLYDRFQVLLQEEQPVTFLYEYRRYVGARKELRNVQPNSITTFFGLSEWELRPDAD